MSRTPADYVTGAAILAHALPTVACLAVALLGAPALLHAQSEPTEEEIGPVQVLRSEQEALHEIFGAIDSLHCDTVHVTDTMRDSLQAALQRQIRDTAYVVYTVYTNGASPGMAIVADEQGKYRPITFMAGIDSSLHIVDVRVLVYRESRGGEVERTRFLRQYRDKGIDDPIRINRDMINITGATISVRALNEGVRKALRVAQYLRGTEKTPENHR